MNIGKGLEKIVKIALPFVVASSLYAKGDVNNEGKIQEPPVINNETIINSEQTHNINNHIEVPINFTIIIPDGIYKDSTKTVKTETKQETEKDWIEAHPDFQDENVKGSHSVEEVPETEESKIIVPGKEKEMKALFQIYDKLDNGYSLGINYFKKGVLDSLSESAVIKAGVNKMIYSNEFFNVNGGLEIKLFSPAQGDIGVQFNPEIEIYGNTIGTGLGIMGHIIDGKDAPSFGYLIGKFGIGNGPDLAAAVTGKIGVRDDMQVRYGAKGQIYCNLNDNWRTKIEAGKSNFNDLLTGNDGYFDMTVLNGKKNGVQYGFNLGVRSPLSMQELYRNSDETSVKDLYKDIVVSAGPRLYVPLEEKLGEVKRYLEAGINLGAQFPGDNSASVVKVSGELKSNF